FDLQMTPEQRIQGEWEIANMGRITMRQFKVIAAVLLSIALFSFFGRIFIRLFTQRRLYMDDGFLTLALACLCAGTIIVYERMQIICLQSAILQKNPTALQIAREQMDDIYDQSGWQFAYLFLLWTTLFAVKWCYFAFFHPFLQAMSNWRIFILYYRFSICFSVFSWLLIVVGGQLIICPYVGRTSSNLQCFPAAKLPVPDAVLFLLSWACPTLDALTDIMVISIPIVILRQSRMRTLTKLELGSLMCLSALMVTCSIIRAVGANQGGAPEYQWQTFWLQAESCIAVVMGSITVYHPTLLTGSNNSGVSWLPKFSNWFKG
ncbi:hypothetical protein V8E54_014935, partial [Elaphomyces granulatus]